MEKRANFTSSHITVKNETLSQIIFLTFGIKMLWMQIIFALGEPNISTKVYRVYI